MSLIDKTERDDFNQLVKQAGFTEEDFTLSAVADLAPASGGIIYPDTGTVTVRCVKTGIERSYRAGHATSWPYDAGEDVKRGEFGQP
jgi:hypothetical protein